MAGTTYEGVEDIGGTACYKLSFSYSDSVRSSIWVDPTHGYRMRKSETYWKDGMLTGRCEVSEFVEARENIWLPKSGTWNTWDEYGWSRRRRMNLESFKLNEEVADTLFEFAFPSRTLGRDERTGQRFLVKEDKITYLPSEP